MTVEQPVEVELKYRLVDAAAGERLLNGDALGQLQAATQPRSSRSEDRYVDTPDGAIERAGFAARFRTEKGATVVTLKSLATTAGALQRRTELEGPTDGTEVPAGWPASPARSMVLELCGDAPLQEVATVRQRRRKRRFAAGETVVELSLDDVEIISGGQRIERFGELEIELVSGPEEPLLDAGRALAEDAALTPSASSKLEAARAALRRHAEAAAAKAAAEAARPVPSPETLAILEAIAALPAGRTPGVTTDDVVAEAGRKVLRFHLARMVAKETGTRLGEDPEELHAMRVATRRMRAAWRVFGEGFRPDQTRKFRIALRDLARKLGAVRDLDVLIIALEEYSATVGPDDRPGLEPLFVDWRAQRDAARTVLMHELDSGRYRRFVESFVTFSLTPGAAALAVSPTDPHHVRDTQGSRIWHAYEAVLAYGPVLRWADVPTLHQMRIAGKWLRYTLEFVGEPLGADAKPLIARVTALQDHLGLMNDAEVAAMKARALLVARAGTLTDSETASVGRYLASREREVARLKRTAAGPWRAIASIAFRRTLGRAIANLAATKAATTV